MELAVLTQGGHEDTPEYIQNLREFFTGRHVDLYYLNWAGGPGDYSLTFPTTTSQGRQLLYELVRRDHGEYDYYLCIDDDVLFDETSLGMIMEFIENWNPLVACFNTHKIFHGRPIWDLRYTKRKEGVGRFLTSDGNNKLYHWSVLDKMFPLLFHSSLWCTRIIDWVVYNIHPDKLIRSFDIKVNNEKRRKRGPGHGPHFMHLDKVQTVWNKVLKKPYGPITGYARENGELAYEEPSHEAVVLENIAPMVDTGHPLWLKREKLLDIYSL